MSRQFIILYSKDDRMRAQAYINSAPTGTRVEIKAPKRSLPQNDLMWALLTDVAAQKEHGGRKYTPDMWKVIFLHAIGREVQFIPSLDGEEVVPWGQSSSDLSRQEMTALIEFIYAWGAQNGVTFHGPNEKAVA